MGALATVEAALIDAIKAPLAGRVRAVESCPGVWTEDELSARLRQTPGVFVGFVGGRPVAGEDTLRLDTRWMVYVLTEDVGGELARRHGRAGQIGAWDIVEAIAPVLHGLVVDGLGTVTLLDSRNLVTGQLDRQALALYGLELGLPLPLELPVDGSLDDFATFDAQFDIPPHVSRAEHDKWLQEPPDHTTSTPDADDTVTGLDSL